MRRLVSLLILTTLASCDSTPHSNGAGDVRLVTSTPAYRTEPVNSGRVLGEQRVAVILARFANMEPATDSPEEYRQAIFEGDRSINAYIREVSYGKAWLTGEVFGWFDIEDDLLCGREFDDVYIRMKDAVVRAVDDQVDFSGFNRIMIFTPQKTDQNCITAGNGTVGTIPLETDDGTVQASVMHVNYGGYLNTAWRVATYTGTHEFLHNLGLWHENAYECGIFDPARIAACSAREYGNPFSILGANVGLHITAFAREWLGWLDEEQILTARESGDYVIYPLELNDGGAKAIRIPMPEPFDVNTVSDSFPKPVTEYYLEFRRPTGFDRAENRQPDRPGASGVLLTTWVVRENTFSRYGETRSEMTTLFIDTTPRSVTGGPGDLSDFRDGVMMSGDRYVDETNGILIDVREIREDGAAVIRVLLDQDS